MDDVRVISLLMMLAPVLGNDRALVWIAVALLVGQALIAAILILFKKTLGTFTESLLATHKSNLLVLRSNDGMVQRMEAVSEQLKLTSQLAVDRACQHCHDDGERIA